MIFLKRKSVSLTEVTILLKSVRMMRKNPLSLLFFLTKAPPLPLLLSKELNKQQRNTVSFIIFTVCDFLFLFLICQVKSYHNYYINKKHKHRMYLFWRLSSHKLNPVTWLFKVTECLFASFSCSSALIVKKKTD